MSQLNCQNDMINDTAMHPEEIKANMCNRMKLDGLSYGASSANLHRGRSNHLAAPEDGASEMGDAIHRQHRHLNHVSPCCRSSIVRSRRITGELG